MDDGRMKDSGEVMDDGRMKAGGVMDDGKIMAGGREELLRYCGSMEQAAGVRRISYEDGRASRLRCALVQNGALEFPIALRMPEPML